MATGRQRGALEDAIVRMVDDLSIKHGWSWATEGGMRAELERRTGRRVGERSIGRVLRRLEAEGKIVHRRILPGERMPNGKLTSHGSQRNRYVPRWQKRAEEKRKARARARAETTARQRAVAEAAAAVRPAPKPQRKEPERVQLTAAEQQELSRLLADEDYVQLALFWSSRAKPPDNDA